MSDVQFLFAILGVLYVWECLCWLRRGGVAFSIWTGRDWHIQHPATMVGNQRGGFVLAAPVPPLGVIFAAQQFPFSLSPTGVLGFVASNVNPGWRPAQTAQFFTWEEMSQLRIDGKKLLLQKRKIFSAPTVTFANYLLAELKDISKLPSAERATAIKKILHHTLDTQKIETLRRDFNQQIRPIRYFANALFGLVFIIAPLLIGIIGIKLVWPWLLLALLGITISTATLFARLHRKLYPAAADDRFAQTLMIALAPATTMRAHDIVSRPLFENFHPLPVAKNLLAAVPFHSFARRLLLDLRHPVLPVCPNPKPEALATEAFFRSAYLETIEAWLRENKIPPDELCCPPVAADEFCQAYCPRCEAQFTTSLGQCADCGGLPLVAFGKAS